MKKLILGLVTVAVGLAVACAYLLNQIEVERGRTRAEADRRQELQARVKQIEREQLAAANQDSGIDALRAAREDLSKQPASSARDVAPDGNKTSGLKATGNDQLAWRRRMLEDPAGRELLRAQQRAELHAANPTLARDLGLTKAEYDRLLELLAEQALQRMELFAREDSISASLLDKLKELDGDDERYVADLLGDQKAQQYQKYVASQPVRAQVSQFRARLGEANALRDGQSARLVTVLQGQRERFAKELQEHYAGHNVTRTLGTWYGGQFMASDTMSTSAEEQILAQMEDYNRRLIHGAASVLTESQLEVFTQIQDERLTHQRVQLRANADAHGQ
jgi:hypothetical protein